MSTFIAKNIYQKHEKSGNLYVDLEVRFENVIPDAAIEVSSKNKRVDVYADIKGESIFIETKRFLDWTSINKDAFRLARLINLDNNRQLCCFVASVKFWYRDEKHYDYKDHFRNRIAGQYLNDAGIDFNIETLCFELPSHLTNEKFDKF